MWNIFIWYLFILSLTSHFQSIFFLNSISVLSHKIYEWFLLHYPSVGDRWSERIIIKDLDLVTMISDNDNNAAWRLI